MWEYEKIVKDRNLEFIPLDLKTECIYDKLKNRKFDLVIFHNVAHLLCNKDVVHNILNSMSSISESDLLLRFKYLDGKVTLPGCNDRELDIDEYLLLLNRNGYHVVHQGVDSDNYNNYKFALMRR